MKAKTETMNVLTRYVRWIVFATLSIIHFSLSAQPLAGRWIGVHTEWDLDSFCPLPAYMDFNPDSTWQLGLIDESAAPRTGRWGMEGRVLRVDTTHYAPELVSLQGDLLRIGRVQPMLFRRFRVVSMARETVWQRLAGQVWQSDSVQYLIAANGRVGIRNRKSGGQTVHCAEVLAMDKSAFLVIRGSFRSWMPITKSGNLIPELPTNFGPLSAMNYPEICLAPMNRGKRRWWFPAFFGLSMGA